MAARGFCEHGKVWTTCGVCGKEVIAAAANKRASSGDEFAEFRPKKPTVKPPPEEPPEDAAAADDETS